MKNNLPTDSIPERLTRSLRRPVWKKLVSSVLLAQFGFWSVQVRGVDYTWSGGSNDWNTTSNFWNTSTVPWVNGFGNNAIFGGTAGTVSLTEAISAGGLTFNSSGYVVTGNTLTLGGTASAASPIIAVNNNGLGTNRATISSLISGTAGLTKRGNGTLVLTNNANDFSGDIAVRQGQLLITNVGQLGTGTNAISITGIGGTGNPGYTGGSLVLHGSVNSASGTGLTLNREVTGSGRGANAVNNTGSVVSVGYNTLAGGLTFGSAAGDNRIWATHGTTTITGDVNIAGTGQNNGFQGNGNWTIAGVVTGAELSNDRFLKLGQGVSTTLWLQNSNNNFAQSLRIDSGTVRVSTNGALGINNGTGSVDLNNGTIEFRTDAAAGFAGRTLRIRNNTTGVVFMDHDISGALGIGSSLQNQTITLGNFIRDTGGNAGNLTFNGRNGYGISLLSAPAAGDYRGITLTNNSSGTVTIIGDVWNANNATASTFTVAGSAETVINGSVVTSAVANNLTKNGSGVFYYNGSAGTYQGATTINAGTLAISNVGGVAGTSGILIGNATTTPATLTYTGEAAVLARPITFNVTTGNAYIEASGTGALTLSPTTLTNGVGAGGAHTIFLGGTNTADNTLTAAISAGVAGVTSLQKYGPGTWVIAPTTSNAFTGSTTISNGILRLADAAGINLLPDAGAVIFNVDTFSQAAGGTLNYVGGAETETVGALTSTAGHGVINATSGTLTFASLASRTAGGTVNVSNSGTVAVTGTAGFLNSGTYFNGSDFAFSGVGTTLRAPVYGTDAGFATSGTALTSGSHNEITGSFATNTVSINSLKISGAQALSLNAAQTITIGTAAGSGIIQTGGSGVISGGAAIAPSATANDFSIRVEGSGNTLTVNTPLTASTAGLTKSGAGTLILGANNTITGAGLVSVNEGTLQLATGGTIGATDIDLSVRQNATFDLNGVSVGTVASATNSVDILRGAGTITNSGGLATLRVGNGNGAGYFTGIISGGGNMHLVKAGTAALSLTNMASNFGTLTISGGTVAFSLPAGTTTLNSGSSSPIGFGASAAALVFNGGTLQYTGSNGAIFSSTQSPSFSTNREFTLLGNGTIQSSGQYGNNVLTAGGSNNASMIWSSTADLSFSGTGVRTLTLGGTSTGDNEIRLRMRDNPSAATDYLSLTKADAGLWILNPATSNTYGGTTTVSGGALRVASSASAVLGLSASSPLVLNGGVIETSGTFSRSLGAPVAGNGTTVQLPAGASGFAAATPDRLVVTLGGGGVTWGSTNFNPSSFVLGSGTALGETEFTNDIALGTSARTVTVNANAGTGTMVTAGILSGVISGGAGGILQKNGGGVLMLGNANTYVGNTVLQDGTLIVSSIGNSAGTSSSSLGASGGAFQYNGNATLNFMYAGPGETSSRPFQISTALTAARTYRLESSGSGPLVLDNFQNNSTGNFALLFEIRGSNADNNRINSVISNGSAGGSPHLIKADGGVWILGNTANTFSGGVRADGGLLGLTASGSLGSAGTLAPTTAATSNATTVTVASTTNLRPGMLVNGSGVGYGDYIVSITNATQFVLSATRTIASGAQLQFGGLAMSNGGIFNADSSSMLTISQPVTFNTNATSVFAGQGSINMSGTLQLVAGDSDITLSNNLENGAILTLSGPVANYKANNRVINLRGFGSTVWSGLVPDAAANTTGLSIAIANDASLTFSGGTANTYTGTTTLSQGTLILNKTLGIAQIGAGTSPVSFNGGVLQSNAGPLTGSNALANPVTLAGDPATVGGSNSIQFSATTAIVNSAGNRALINNLSGGAVLTVSGAVSLSNDNTGRTLTLLGGSPTTISGVIQNGGTGAGNLTYSGTNTLSATALNTATGALTANRGTISLSGANGAWSAGTFAMNLGGTLTLDNSVNNNSNRMGDTGAITFAGGTLNLIGNTTSEVAGALTINGTDAIINMSGTGTNTLTFTSATFSVSGSSLNLSGVSGTNSVIFTTAPVLTNNIHPRIFLGGGDFATHGGNGTAITTFTGYAAGADINSGATTDTYKITSSYTVDDLTASRTMNALSISDTSARNISAVGNSLLTVTSGAIIANGGVTHTLSVPRMNLGGATIQTTTGTTLDITGTVSVGTTLTKALPGTLQLSAKQWFNSTINVNEGALILNGGDNTLLPGFGILNVDANASVDLKGSIQYVQSLGSSGLLPGTGGTVSTSVNGGLLVSGSAGSTWAGTISGTNLNFARTGGNVTMALQQAQTYTGTTTLMGGILALENDATILNTSSIDINYAALSLNNNSNLQTQINNRISDTAPITLRGGTLTYNGRVSTVATETFGALTLDQGSSILTAAVGGGTISSVDLSFTSLTRSNNSTINFTGTTLGQPGNGARIVFSTPVPATNGGMIGAWAIANSTDYAAYNTGLGVGVVGQGGFVGYDPVFGTGKLTQIPATANLVTTLTASTTNAAILRLAGAFTNSIAFTNASDTLNLELGGLLRSDNNNASSIGTTAIRGVLTSGISELISYNNQNTLTINSVIAGATRYIKDGAGTVTLTAPNTYTLGTIVNRGTLNISPTTAGDVVIPNSLNGLVINGGGQNAGSTANLTVSNAIGSSNDLTLNGRGALTMSASVVQTLNKVTLNNNGGDVGPTITINNTGGVLSLTNATPITATSSNASTTATITGGMLALGAGAKTFDIAPISLGSQVYTTIAPTLSIASAITGTGPINKVGTGLLALSGASTFTGLNVNVGGVIVGANSTTTAGTVTSGPLGLGQVTMASGTSLFTSGNFSVGNDVSFSGTPTFNSTATTAWTLSLTGNLTGAGLSGGTPTVEVTNPGLTVALLGNLPAASSYTKTGLGTLIFNATNYTGDFNATALGNPNAISLIHDGDRTGSVQTISMGNVIFDSGIVPNITINRGGSLPFPLAANKILAPASISGLSAGLTVNVNAGYGLKVSDNIALAGLPAFTVTGTQASNVIQGLYVEGNITGIGFVKTGSGTMVINNPVPANNTFTGNVNINQGVVSVSSDAQLGNASNLVLLNPQTGTAALRATSTFATSRVIQLSNAVNTRAIEVTAGNTLTLNSAFDLNGGAGTTGSLNKLEPGTLFLNASNATWNGALNILQGAVLVNNAAALGTGQININNPASALQLQGGITVTNPIGLDISANNLTLTGINTGGAIQAVTGANIISGTITVTNAAATADNSSRNFGFGADSGASLQLGNINFSTAGGGTNRNTIVYLGGAGDVTLAGVLDNTNGTPASSFLFKYGTGNLAITAANAIPDNEVRLYRGATTLNGAGTFGTGTTQVQVWQGASLTLDNSVTNTGSRFSNRIVQIGGGVLNFIPNASGTTHTSTGALQISQGSNVINLAAGGNQTVTFGSLTQNGGATVDMTGTFGTANNKLTFTTAPTLSPATTGLLARFTTNGNEFASYDATNGVKTFTGYAPVVNILSAAATQTFKATPSTLNSLTGNQTINALAINNTAAVGGLGGNPPSTLTLTSGGILANGTGGAFLNVPIVAFGGAEGIVHVQSGQSLTVNSGMSGTAGLTKALNGTLNINAQQFISGTYYVNAGTLKLTTSGITNPLLFNQSLAVSAGATLDLNGQNQFFSNFSSASAGSGNGVLGGTITNTGGSQSTLVINSNSNFGGFISGDIYLNKTGTNALNLQQAMTYTGPTLITGGTVTLADNATLPNTSQPININYGTLSLSNGNLLAIGNRVNDSAPITMRGGAISVNGRQGSATTETFGAITIQEGHNQFTTNLGGTNVNSVDVTAASLTRAVGSTATMRFNATGQLGSAGRLRFTSAPTLTNNIIGPWAIVDREFASYDATYGIGALNGTGFAGYSAVGLNGGPTASDNVRLGVAGITTLLSNATVNTLTFGQQAAATTLDLGGNALSTNAVLFGQGTDNVNFGVTNGTLRGPSGGGDLYLIHANYTGTNRTVSIDAAIGDNGGPTRVIKTSGDGGTSVMTWNGTNTYTGGLVLNIGTLTLGATSTLGTGGITVNQATLNQTAGAIIPSQALTLGGGSTVTLAGNNSLTGVTINNMGGGAPTLTPTGVLTLTGGINVSTVNAGAVATIGTGTIDLNGVSNYAINVGATVINGVDVAPWQAGLSISSLIQNGGINKTGPGLLQLNSTLSTFSGGVNVAAGGLVIGASSVGPNLGDPLTSGPLGTGTVTMAANTSLVGSAAVSVTNDFVFLGDTVFNGTNNITLNGNTTLPSVWNAVVTAPQTTVTIGNVINSLSSDVTNKSGLGTLVLGNYNGTINIAGGLIFLADGNTLGTVENISLGGNLNLTADTAVTINRSGASPNARNKILQKVNLTNNGSILAVNNQSGYGLEFTGTTSLTAASHFSVAQATASNVTQGLILSGVVSDTGGFDLVKSGPGTLFLTNAGNTFGGAGKNIDILNGILAASSDGALGNSGNSVSLQVDGTTGVGFRATGPSWSTSRTFNLNALNNAIEVTAGTVFTLNTAFGLSAVSNTLTKNDNGVFEINADNSTWTGGITINAGAVRLSNANAAGSGTISISPNAAAVGAALQLSGGISISNPISLQGNNNVAFGGINFGGQLESVSGINTVTAPITLSFDSAIGAASGATLNINGGINNPTTTGRALVFTGAGTINLNSNVTSSTATANQYFSMRKFGSGTLNISSALSIIPTDSGTGLQVHAGTMALSGAGTLAGGNTIGLQVLPGATLTLDNAVTNVANRLGGRPVTLNGANLNLIGNTAVNTAESIGAPQLNRGLSVITVTAQTGFQTDLTFTGAANNPASAQNSTSGGPTGASILFRGTSLGSAAGAGVATIRNTGGFSFAGQTGVTGTATKGIMPYALIDSTVGGNGVSFATGDAAAAATTTTAIVRPLAANEYAASNSFVANNNINLTTGTTSIGAATLNVNSLTIAGNAGVTIPAFLQLTSSSGGILVKTGSTSTISGGIINQANTASPLNIWTLGDLTISSLLIGGNGTTSGAVGFVKAGAGTLTLSTPVSNISGLTTSVNTYSGQLVINQGTLKLNGGKNTIQANNFLAINGGTLDLNGNSQQTLSLFTDGSVDGAGGIVTSSTGTGNLVINQDNAARNWAGSIQGSVNFTRSGQNTLTIYSPQSYTGTTVINAGTTTFRDNASLLGTTAISLGYATVNFDNNGGVQNLTDRINDAASIEMRGATLNILGRAQMASSETIGNVSIVEGFNVINPSVGGTGINSMDLTVASLSRPAGSAAIFFANGTNLGTIGSNSRIMVGSINGVTTTNPTYSANGSGLTNNIVGGWAISNNDFLTYIPGLGLAPLNQTGAAQYDLNNTFVGAVATDNVRLTATTNLAAAVTNVNALSLSGSNINLTFGAATNLLNITSGGLIGTNNNNTIGASVDSGRLTAGGLTPGAVSDLYLYNRANTMTINARIVDNTSGGTSRVRAVFSASGGAFSLVNPNASYTGGTVLNAGTLNLNNTSATPVIPAANTPADGLVINGGTVTMNNFAGQIAASNIVTLNGGSTLNLWGNNTLNGLIFNNKGGTGNPSVLTYSTAAAAGAAATGVLTIGSGGIVATSSNVGTTNLIEGRVDFGTSLNSISVDTINVNGTNDVVPLQAGFLLRGVVGTSGGFSKIGNGVLGLAAQMHYTGPTNVDAGGIRISAVNGGSRFSSYTLAAGTRLDLAGSSTQLGSIAGAGVIFNSGGAATLQTGFDNTDTTFSGQFNRFNDATAGNLVLQKIGTGTLTLTGAQSTSNGTTGTFTVNGGTLAFSGAGAWFTGTTSPAFAGSFTVNNGGRLRLDNTAGNLNNRLGLNATGTLNLQGGTLAIQGNSAAATTEAITTFNVLNGGGRVELTADPARALTLAITTLNTANATGALVITGITGAATGAGVANLTIGTPNLIAGQGTGANGTVTMGVRHDILADASVSGLGTGFLVRDTVTSNYRALAASELAPAIALPLTTDVDAVTAGNQGAGVLNVGLVGTTQSLTVNSVANTLTISGTTTVNSGLSSAFGIYGPGGGPLGLTLSQAAASLTLAGATANINVGNFGSTSAGTTIYSHVIAGGALNVNSYFGIGNTGGFHKAQGGSMTLNKAAFYTGTTNVSNGALSLNSGAANTIAVVPGASTPTLSALSINGTGAVVNLNGFDQVVGALSSVNPIPGNSGSVTSATPAMFTTVTQAASGVYAGTIDGALSFTRAGTNTTTLTNASTYTGSTVIRGGTLQLRDSGSILNTSSITSHYGTLLIDNQGLNANGTPNPTRISASAPVTLAGAAVTLNSAASTDNTLVMNSVTVTGGNNTINVLPYINGGSTAKITIGNLVRNTNTRSGVNFNGFSQLNGGNGSSTLGGQGFSVNGNIILNQINGTNFTAANLVNNLIGGWAVADGNTFATYVNGFGVSVMGQTTAGIAAPGFDGTDISASTATQNINDGTATGRTISGARSANSWRAAPSATQTVNVATASSLSLAVGLITNSTSTINLQGADATSTLTSSSPELYIYLNQGTTNINTKITGSFALIRNGGGTLSLASPTTAAGSSNDYTGGTFINGGTTNLNGAAGMTIIPAGPAGAGLVITNATVTQNTNAQQIAATTDVVIRGAGNLNLTTGANTLNSITWDNQGGAGNPTVNGGTGLLTLTAANAITATNDSFATTPVLSGAGGLALSSATPVINVGGQSVNGLNISAVISSAGGAITKTGLGALTLSAASTFTTGFNLNQGSLILGASSTGAVTNGPVGTGTLTIEGGTSLLSDGTIRTIANATTINGDFTFGGVVAGNGVILSGAVNLGASERTITVTSPAVVSTISGAISSTSTGNAFVKAGAGTLVLSNAGNNFGGADVAVTGGILRLGANNAIPAASGLDISSGAGFDLAGFDQVIDGLSGAGFVTNSANSAKTLSITSTSTNSSFSGMLTDNILGAASSRLNILKSGAGTTQSLTNVANDYSGTTTINGGALEVTKLANGGAVSSIGKSTNAATNLVINGADATLRYTGAGDSTDRSFTVGTAGAAIESSGTGALTWNGTATVSTAGARTLTLGGTNTAANTFTTAVTNGSGTIALAKTGTGNWVMTANNTYTGGTSVNGGVLQVGTTATAGTAALSGSGAVAVNAGGTLTGTGTVTGNVTVQGAVGNLGVLTPGDNFGATKAQMNLGGSLTVTTGGQLQFQLTTPTVNAAVLDPTFLGGYSDALAYLSNPGNAAQLAQWNSVPTLGNSDFINVAGGLTINSNRADGNYGSGIIQLFTTGYTPQFGDVFNLIDWVGAMGGATFNAGTGFSSGGVFGDFDLPTLAGGYAWDTSAFVQYGVIVVVPEPGRALLMLLGLMALFFRRRRRD